MEAAGFGQDRTRRGWILGHLCSLLATALLASSLVQGAQGSQNQAGCGKPLVSGRILNGQNAQDGAWPWQVSVRQNGSHICGGTLISESWVVSAAQCFRPSALGKPSPCGVMCGCFPAALPQRWLHFSTTQAIPLWYHYAAVPQQCFPASRPVINSVYRVQLGETRIFDQTRNQTFSAVKRIILHPSYDSATHQADIALVELENPISLTATISPVCLLDASVHVPAGKSCWVTGWGKRLPQVSSSLSATLQEVEVLAVDSTACNSRYREALKKPVGYSLIKDDMLCAGDMKGYKGFAPGDGGGPLVCQENGTWYLGGIVSWLLTTTVNGVTSVADGYPGVYNRPNAHNEWIQKNVPGVTFTVVKFSPNSAHSSVVIIHRVLPLTVLLWLTL
ncbi:serine protease 33-like [Trachemys scripta elegans]|uniref:serine protease 33-like n=1 Tax=Trachemys scripta elegans TaxID=31138 RepID=UPI001552F70D|nr:serine protease 33-like [Trachemys scripta elegans]